MKHQDRETGVCIVCGREVELAVAHWVHHKNCPQLQGWDRCTCNPVAHPEHCPADECQEASP